MSKPLILVTNDDGIDAKGIRSLIEVMNTLGDVVVAAPATVQSGQAHAVTIHTVLHMDAVTIDDGPQKEYKINGTPVDCVKLSLAHVLERKPDLLVSGINHGSNSSINVLYSGTMGAAIEGGIEGIPSIGFSLANYDHDADFTAAKHYALQIARSVLKNGLPEGVALNVNIPDLPLAEIKGIKVARQSHDRWEETYEKRVNPFGKEYYWLKGDFSHNDQGEDTDTYALANNYVAVVPVHFDMTAHKLLDKVKNIIE